MAAPNEDEIRSMVTRMFQESGLAPQEPKRGFRLNGEVNLGHMLTVLALVIGFGGAAITFNTNAKRTEWRVEALEKSNEQIIQTQKDLARNQADIVKTQNQQEGTTNKLVSLFEVITKSRTQ